MLEEVLSRPDIVVRLYEALSAEEDELRVHAARRLVLQFNKDSESILLRFLNSKDFYDRMCLAPLAEHFSSQAVATKIVDLVMNDPVALVRGKACLGLEGQDLRIAIPALLKAMEDSGDESDESGEYECLVPPCEIAQLSLDAVLGISFVSLRTGDRCSTFPPDGFRPEALVAHAKEVLKRLQGE
jgi:hypothetical protein